MTDIEYVVHHSSRYPFSFEWNNELIVVFRELCGREHRISKDIREQMSNPPTLKQIQLYRQSITVMMDTPDVNAESVEEFFDQNGPECVVAARQALDTWMQASHEHLTG